MKTHQKQTHASENLAGGCWIAPPKKLLAALLMLSLLCLQTISGWSQIINTVAGNGSASYSTGGGVATAAAIYFPRGVRAVPGGGFIFAAESNNHLIRQVTAGGTISDVAGTPTVNGYAGDGGLATAAQLNSPCDVTLDNLGNIFICDRLNHVIRRVDVGTGIITTYAGTGGVAG